ncbi:MULTISPECIES: DUF4157 domain-containing protein [Actinoalloteichus]|uniref:DUF4157 family protein n=1 Tax=Actinoalloteichus fjordicus TaxID=1612552 RepID=A0AAC9PT38_9PSEU|nr:MULTISPECIES: DUF4157 domain-containing protein [Actinoalloteichus]APU15680.1 putative DUF4157 family protein [Actinoalloteichus fjordicus]APU21740.1 putative DUF4157 family protein [Actinoalloteichus sp. GBA129-24]
MRAQEKQDQTEPPRRRREPTVDTDVPSVPDRLTPAGVYALQRSVGNAAVARLLAGRPEAPADGPAGQHTSVPDVLRSSGRPLDEATRDDMESRLGADFSDVRVHTGTAARRSAAEIGSRAYTSGNHVVIGDGGGDRHTLAHELVHVMQQRSGPVSGTDDGSGLSVSDPSDRFEREAEQTAHRVMSRRPSAPARLAAAGPSGTVQRAPGTEVQRAAGDPPGAQLSLRSLARRWKTQSFFSLTTGRSGELQRVDAAVDAWRRAEAEDPSSNHPDLLRAVQQAVRDWRAAKAGGGTSFRGVHVNSLARRVALVLGEGPAPSTGSPTEGVEEEDSEVLPVVEAPGGGDLAEEERAPSERVPSKHAPSGRSPSPGDGEKSEEEFFSDQDIEENVTLSESDSDSGAEGDPWIYSTSGNVAIGRRSQTKDLYAAESVIATANAELEASGAAVRLRKADGEVPGELAERGLTKWRPVIVAGGQERGDEDMLSPDQCIEVARDVTGKSLNKVLLAPDEGTTERVEHDQRPDDVIGLTSYPRLVTRPGMTPGGLARRLPSDDGYLLFSWRNVDVDVDIEEEHEGEVVPAMKAVRTALTDAGMPLGHASTLLNAMRSQVLETYPALQQILVDRLEDAGVFDREPTDDTKNSIQTTTGNVARLAKSRYRPYDRPDPERDGRLGINESADARVGEALAIYSTRGRSRAEQVADQESGARPPWAYHFAGVVLTDGEDKVTLENYNRRGKPNANRMWYFALYGPGRTFHEAHRETVTGALTLAMR